MPRPTTPQKIFSSLVKMKNETAKNCSNQSRRNRCLGRRRSESHLSCLISVPDWKNEAHWEVEKAAHFETANANTNKKRWSIVSRGKLSLISLCSSFRWLSVRVCRRCEWANYSGKLSSAASDERPGISSVQKCVNLCVEYSPLNIFK